MLRYHAVSGVDPSRRLMPSIATWCHFLIFFEGCHVFWTCRKFYVSFCMSRAMFHLMTFQQFPTAFLDHFITMCLLCFHTVFLYCHILSLRMWQVSNGWPQAPRPCSRPRGATGRMRTGEDVEIVEIRWNMLKALKALNRELFETSEIWNLYWLVPMSWKLLNPFLTASSFGLWKDVLSNSWWKQWKLWVCTAWAFRAHRWERWKSARMQQRFCRSPETSRTRASYFQMWFGKIWRRMHDARNRLMRSSHTSPLPSP